MFNAPEPQATNPELVEDAQDGDTAEREDADLENISISQAADDAGQIAIDPRLDQQTHKDAQPALIADGQPLGEIQILDLHSDEPLVSYRNHIFRGTWCENIGTEMIFTPHDESAPLPALRHLGHGIDLLAASAARVNFREATLISKEEADAAGAGSDAGQDAEKDEEELPERYKRNGGIYIHVGGDKSGQRQPQAHFLEDFIALKRSRGEMDDVTVQPVETRHNQLMVDDEEEERRRKKLQTDQARAVRWGEIRRASMEMAHAAEDSYAPRRKSSGRGRGSGHRGRGRAPLLLRTPVGDTDDVLDPALR